MSKRIKFNRDIAFCPDGIIAKKGKKGETYEIPDNLVPTIEELNGGAAACKKSAAPENKAKG